MRKSLNFYLISSSLLILAACNTTGSNGEFETLDVTDNSVSTGEATAKINQTAESEVELTLNGEKIKLSKADLKDPNKANRFRIFVQGGERVSKDDVDKSKPYDSLRLDLTEDRENVKLWRVAHFNGEDKTYRLGFTPVGEKTEKLPTDLKATYEGGFGWSILYDKSKPFDNRKLDFYGDMAIDVDFAKSTLSGKMYNITAFDKDDVEQNVKGEIAVSNGQITSSNITADLKSNADLNKSLEIDESLTGKLDGSFYGKDADHLVGTGTLGNKNYEGKFGYGLDK